MKAPPPLTPPRGYSDSGLKQSFEPIWSLFQGALSTATQGGPISERSQDGQPIPQKGSPSLLGKPDPQTALFPSHLPPYFLSTGLNLARAWLDATACEEAKASSSQNHHEAKAKTCPSQDTYFCSLRDESNERPLCSISWLESGTRPG